MPRFYGTRRYSVWETFEFDAEDEEQALANLKRGFMIGPVVGEMIGEEYFDVEVERIKDNDS